MALLINDDGDRFIIDTIPATPDKRALRILGAGLRAPARQQSLEIIPGDPEQNFYLLES